MSTQHESRTHETVASAICLDSKNRQTGLRHEVGGRSQVRSSFDDPLRSHMGNNFVKQGLARGLSVERSAEASAALGKPYVIYHSDDLLSEQ
jgi:hypothetical protein